MNEKVSAGYYGQDAPAFTNFPQPAREMTIGEKSKELAEAALRLAQVVEDYRERGRLHSAAGAEVGAATQQYEQALERFAQEMKR